MPRQIGLERETTVFGGSMRIRRFYVAFSSAVLALAVGLAVPAAGAQTRGGIYVTPIPGAQFSGIVRVDRVDVQPNGNTLSLWSERQIARDATGRIYNEYRPFAPATVNKVPPVVSIHLYDPQSRMSEYLYPQRKTYQMMILNRPPATDTLDDFASSTAGSAQPSEFTRQEDLGYRTIAGLQAHGVRITQSLPAEQSGTGQEVKLTNEYWYSEVLRLNLMTKHNDPRTGSVTMTVTQIDRAAPSAALFGVPADYQMDGAAR
jgi:hypothetical protein